MQCDFRNVTDILYRNRKSSSQITYNTIVNTLLGSYLKENSIYEFPDYTLSKLHKGTIGVSPEVKDYYQYVDAEKVKKDIRAALDYLFDKPNTYHELYQLIQYDEALSVSMRTGILKKYPDTYTDDNALTDLLYDAISLAINRLYYKDESRVAARYYSEDIAVIGDSLFRNSEYILPCKYFCGRDDELKELHDVVSENPATIITGIAGIGKSELVRAYVKEHKKEYQYIGYYFYKGSLKTIIANIINDPIDTDDDERYHKNLELLSTLGNAALLRYVFVIDGGQMAP